MIISHDYRFIFIRTYKTAGSSVEFALARYLGPLDILTPEHPDDELARLRQGVFPQNFVFTKGTVFTLDPREDDQALKQKIEEFGDGGFVGLKHFGTHNGAQAISQAVGPRIWNGYTKFCIERNPFDYLISLYHWNRRKTAYADFMDFLEQSREYAHNYLLYTIGQRIAVDVLIDYANLAAGLQAVAQRVGLDYDGWMPQLKGKVRGDRRPWHQVISPREEAYIRRHWRLDLEIYSALTNHADPRLRPDYNREGA